VYVHLPVLGNTDAGSGLPFLDSTTRTDRRHASPPETAHARRENCTHMEFNFSTPTPCSPVTVPPSRTLVSRISAPNSSQRRISSGSSASNKINGSDCRRLHEKH